MLLPNYEGDVYFSIVHDVAKFERVNERYEIGDVVHVAAPHKSTTVGNADIVRTRVQGWRKFRKIELCEWAPAFTRFPKSMQCTVRDVFSVKITCNKFPPKFI